MIHHTINLNAEKTATITSYILDSEISFKVKKKRPAIIICPGGGYLMTATKEGEAVALEFTQKGFHTFVLRYTTYFQERMTDLTDIPQINDNARYPNQILELMETIHLLHVNAEAWQIDIENIFVMGFSAGGHITATLGNYWNNSAMINQLSFSPSEKELKPKGLILGYPMLRGDIEEYINKNTPDNQLIKHQIQYTYNCLFGTNNPTKAQIKSTDMRASLNRETPPTFIWTTRNDLITDSKVTTMYVQTMVKKELECEYHLFEDGPHGLALSNALYARNDEDINPEVALWVPLVVNWISKQLKKEKD